MPIRIKPTFDLRPCTIHLEGIKKITELVDKEFTQRAVYSAQDGIWEIYDEPSLSFLSAISTRETLDSFNIHGEIGSGDELREIDITFDKTQANVLFSAAPQYLHWYEHFLIDLKKHLLPPSFGQLMSPVFKGVPYTLALVLPLGFFRSVVVDSVLAMDFRPFSRILIREQIPSQLVENIKGNLISNVIWAILVFVLGIIFTILVQRVTQGS